METYRFFRSVLIDKCGKIPNSVTTFFSPNSSVIKKFKTKLFPQYFVMASMMLWRPQKKFLKTFLRQSHIQNPARHIWLSVLRKLVTAKRCLTGSEYPSVRPCKVEWKLSRPSSVVSRNTYWETKKSRKISVVQEYYYYYYYYYFAF